MDQSKSNSGGDIAIPARTFTLEFLVGLFMMVGVVFAGWLAVGLGGVELISSNRYDVYVEFNNVSGLKDGASVEIAGVAVGAVAGISLKDLDRKAVVTLRLDKEIVLHDDDIAMIRTKGIIGDRYVKISRGASDVVVKPGAKMPEEGESVVDLEELIGKIVHNISSDEDEEKKEEKK